MKKDKKKKKQKKASILKDSPKAALMGSILGVSLLLGALKSMDKDTLKEIMDNCENEEHEENEENEENEKK